MSDAGSVAIGHFANGYNCCVIRYYCPCADRPGSMRPWPCGWPRDSAWAWPGAACAARCPGRSWRSGFSAAAADRTAGRPRPALCPDQGLLRPLFRTPRLDSVPRTHRPRSFDARRAGTGNRERRFHTVSASPWCATPLVSPGISSKAGASSPFKPTVWPCGRNGRMLERMDAAYAFVSPVPPTDPDALP